MPCGPSRMRRRAGEAVAREVGRDQPVGGGLARCAAAWSRRRRAGTPTARRPACRPSRTRAASASASGRAGARPPPPRPACRRCRSCGRSCSASGRGIRRRGCRPRSRRRRPRAGRGPRRRSPARPPAPAETPPRPGWNTEPLCTSSCSAKCEAAALTTAANSGDDVAAVDQHLATGRSAGPCDVAEALDASPPAARPCRRAPSRTSRGTGPRCGDAPAPGCCSKLQRGGEVGEFARGGRHDGGILHVAPSWRAVARSRPR